jgi:hypothetical protein
VAWFMSAFPSPVERLVPNPKSASSRTGFIKWKKYKSRSANQPQRCNGGLHEHGFNLHRSGLNLLPSGAGLLQTGVGLVRGWIQLTPASSQLTPSRCWPGPDRSKVDPAMVSIDSVPE